LEAEAVALDDAAVARLAALLGVKRRAIEDELALLARAERLARSVGADDGEELRLGLFGVVAEEVREAVRLHERRVDVGHGRLAHLGALAALARRLELGLEAFLVDAEAALAPDDLLEVEREPVGVVELERDGARQLLRAAGLDPVVVLVEQLEAARERAPEALLLAARHVDDELLALDELRVDVAHVRDDARGDVVEEGLADAEAVAVADRAAHHAAEHVGAAVTAGEDALADEEGRRASVVGDDAHR